MDPTLLPEFSCEAIGRSAGVSGSFGDQVSDGNGNRAPHRYIVAQLDFGRLNTLLIE
jgi:hypothetical protein